MILYGIQVPILELLAILCLLVVIYLLVMEFEFRQERKIVKDFDEDEVKLSHEIRDLREEIEDLKDLTRSLEHRNKFSDETSE